jgi:hypothetical protein
LPCPARARFPLDPQLETLDIESRFLGKSAVFSNTINNNQQPAIIYLPTSRTGSRSKSRDETSSDRGSVIVQTRRDGRVVGAGGSFHLEPRPHDLDPGEKMSVFHLHHDSTAQVE